jgi:hypothetical protein
MKNDLRLDLPDPQRHGGNPMSVQLIHKYYAEVDRIRRYSGAISKNDAKIAGMEFIVIKLPEAKKGFILLPRCWMVERNFSWTACFRRRVSKGMG